MKKAAGTPATVALQRLGIPYSVHTYEHDPRATSFGMEAAHALQLDPACVFKTLLADLDGSLVVGVVPVTGQLDLKALAAVLGGSRASMAEPDRAARSSGYVVGGISPIGQKRVLRTVIDHTAQLYDVVYVSGGKRGMDLGIAPTDLAAATNGAFAAITRAT